ncbi:hypothetical protein [Streptomyces sp. NPDC003710]
MTYSTPPMPDFPPPAPPEPPKRSRTNAIIIGSAVAVIAAIVTTGVVVANSRDDKPSSGSKTADSTPTGDTVTAAEEPDPTPSDTGPQVFGLTDTVTYTTGVEVTLSHFSRGTSTADASPQNTPFVKFTVRVKNGGTNTLDATALVVNCSYGQDGHSSDAIFDVDTGLNGGPETRVLAGRSINVVWGCALPRGEEALQVEVTPDDESETAIFTGNVK